MEVLPDPAGACNRIERYGSMARSRASPSARLSSFIGGLGALGDPADIDNVTVVAGSGPGIDGRIAGEKCTDQARHDGPPRALLLSPSSRGARAMPSKRTSRAFTLTVARATTSSPRASEYASNCGCVGRSPYQSALTRRPLL